MIKEHSINNNFQKFKTTDFSATKTFPNSRHLQHQQITNFQLPQTFTISPTISITGNPAHVIVHLQQAHKLCALSTGKQNLLRFSASQFRTKTLLSAQTKKKTAASSHGNTRSLKRSNINYRHNSTHKKKPRQDVSTNHTILFNVKFYSTKILYMFSGCEAFSFQGYYSTSTQETSNTQTSKSKHSKKQTRKANNKNSRVRYQSTFKEVKRGRGSEGGTMEVYECREPNKQTHTHSHTCFFFVACLRVEGDSRTHRNRQDTICSNG